MNIKLVVDFDFLCNFKPPPPFWNYSSSLNRIFSRCMIDVDYKIDFTMFECKLVEIDEDKNRDKAIDTKTS